MSSPSCRASAEALKADLGAIDGRQVAGELIWDLLHPRIARKAVSRPAAEGLQRP